MSIYSFLESVTNNIRVTAKTRSFVDNGDGTFDVDLTTITSLKCNSLVLAVGDYVTITGDSLPDLQYKITAINGTVITITQSAGFSFAGYTDATANAPYFDYENWIGESNRLSEKTESTLYANQRFPLVFLLLNQDSNTGENTAYETYNSLTLYFFTNTETANNIRANWRVDNKFEPILYPLKSAFMKELAKQASGIFTQTKQDMPFMGSEGVNQNKFKEYIEAIKVNVNNLTIKTSDFCGCQTRIFN
jgi:hypothetical protein